ncbi:MAG TPA: hypothetical protein PLF25_09120 [Accumulibacter sp.]|nr:hypothetical protein [Accumulibacter sp.]
MARPECESATDAATARRLLALEHFDLVSLDMRLPESGGSLLNVLAGIRLARASLFYSTAKTIIFSATLVQESAAGISAEGAEVLQEVPQIDKYAKSSGAPPVSMARFETLSQRQWAERVLDYLHYDGLYLLSADGKRKLETALGAWLSGAVRSLPPLLARHAQALQNHWPEPGCRVDARAVDAALKFIESALRLAVAQTAVLLGDRRQLPAETTQDELPADTTQDAAIQCLRKLIKDLVKDPALATGSWRTYLDDAAIEAFDEARRLRNTARHSLRGNQTSGEWQALLPCLRRVMDMATYWTKHPLCTDLRYGLDGWRGELLAGTASPRRLENLPGRDFPGEAVRGFWQTAIRRDDDTPAGWHAEAVCWDAWLAGDSRREGALWLKAWRSPTGRTLAIDLDSGDSGPFPGS